MRNSLIALLALSAAACSGGQAPSANAANAVEPVGNQVAALSEGQRDAGFIRAIRDAGLGASACRARSMGEYRGMPVWHARCQAVASGSLWSLTTGPPRSQSWPPIVRQAADLQFALASGTGSGPFADSQERLLRIADAGPDVTWNAVPIDHKGRAILGNAIAEFGEVTGQRVECVPIRRVGGHEAGHLRGRRHPAAHRMRRVRLSRRGAKCTTTFWPRK